MNRFQILIIFLSLTFSVIAQDSEYKYWSKEGALSWNDFKGQKNSNDFMHAMTSSGLSSSLSYQETSVGKIQLQFEVYAIFSKLDSWTDGRNESELLHHEQLHFDIVEIVARRFRKRLYEYDFNPENIKEQYNLLSETFEQMNESLQDQYDKETHHSTNEVKQQEWTAKIKKELNALQEYQQTKIVRWVNYK